MPFMEEQGQANLYVYVPELTIVKLYLNLHVSQSPGANSTLNQVLKF